MRGACCVAGMHAGWRYDPSYQASDYTFSNLDLTTMTNISSGDRRLWVHLLSCWVISLFVWRVRRLHLSQSQLPLDLFSVGGTPWCMHDCRDGAGHALDARGLCAFMGQSRPRSLL